MARQRHRRIHTPEVIEDDFYRAEGDKGLTEEIIAHQGKASAGGRNVVYRHQELWTEDEDENEHHVNLTANYTCDNGHAFSENNRLAGQCWCGKLLCQTRGCTFSCFCCGLVMCREHAVIYDFNPNKIEIYCRRCRWHYWFGSLAGLLR